MSPAQWLLLGCAVGLSVPARAHIGSKDVFEQVEAGPYRLFVTVRTPLVIPGVATVEVRSSGAPVDAIEMTPVPLTGEAAKHPPAADAMQRSSEDKDFYTGSVWLMASGSWQVRLTVDGTAGKAAMGVPVAASATKLLPMQRSLGLLLTGLGLVLVLGMAGIVAAAVREARLRPGVAPGPDRKRRALIASAATLLLLAAAVALGDTWWNVEAASYAEDLYHPSDLHAALHGDVLDLTIGQQRLSERQQSPQPKDAFLLDHGHLMHLYAIRESGMDAVFHLHPEPVTGVSDERHLQLALPAMPPGEYRLYGDVVHASGFPETLTAKLSVPAGLQAVPLGSEDAAAAPPPLRAGELGSRYPLPDGYTMVWDKPAAITAGTGSSFRFRLLDAAGRPAADMQPYLGMAGHAAFVKTDGTVFAHTHPEGSAAMPAMMLAAAAGSGMNDVAEKPVGATVEFPYGFPSAGRYRVFIQMKHGGTVETGVFDAQVR